MPDFENERITQSLAENLLTLLCMDKQQGKLIAGMITENLFDNEVYQLMARRALEYWHDHNRPPGRNHTGDLVNDIIEDRRHPLSVAMNNLVMSMIVLYGDGDGSSGGVNTTYVMNELRTFMRLQSFRRAVMESAEQLANRQQLAISDVEEMWQRILRAREIEFDRGVRLGDFNAMLDWLEKRSVEFTTGIGTLDRAGVVPARASVFLYLAAKGTGKSWFLVNVGKRAWRDGKKVLFITLEMHELLTLQRFYQSLFAVPRTSRIEVGALTSFNLDARGRFLEPIREDVEPDFYLDSDIVRDELASHIMPFGTKINNLIIKGFPPRRLTPEKLVAYMDNLAIVEHFEPDMVVIDYYGLMFTGKAAERRVNLGQSFEEYRAIMIERNQAGVTAQQISRKGAMQMTSKSTDVAEDFSLVQTADVSTVYSASDAERARGLARLATAHAREADDHWASLITQNYSTGQYCLDSMRLPREYDDYLSRITSREEVDAASDD